MIDTTNSLVALALGAGQIWIGYRLAQQDKKRDQAREEMKETALEVKTEALTVAGQVKEAVAENYDATNNKLNEIHVLVNGRLNLALERVEKLEIKLGLTSGEEIPSAAVVTQTEEEITTESNTK